MYFNKRKSLDPSVTDTAPAVDGRDQAVEQWRTQVRRTFGNVRVTADRDEFHRGTIRTHRLRAVDVVWVRADPHTVAGTGPYDPGNDIYFCHLTTGTARLTQDGRESVTEAGNIVCLDGRRPFTLAMPEPFSMIALRLSSPRMSLRVADPTTVTARPWSGRSGVAAVIGHTLSSYVRHAERMVPEMAESLGASFVGLLDLLVTEQQDHSAGAARRALLDDVKGTAHDHLGDADLTPAALARLHHMSVRSLQQLFELDGTSPARWIREERLARCREDLRDPGKAGMTVGAIGERWGLPNASHFSKQFRDRYGVAPRALRTAATHAAGRSGNHG